MAVSIINPSRNLAFNVIAFFNFFALNTNRNEKIRRDIVILDLTHFGSEHAQFLVRAEMSKYAEYRLTHLKTRFDHYEHEYLSYNEMFRREIADLSTERNFEWDWFQLQYDEFFKETMAECKSLSQPQYANGLSDVLLNTFLILRNLNYFPKLIPNISSVPANNPDVLHIADEELDGYEILFNSIFRLRIGWEKLFKLLLGYFGIKPASGFSNILKLSSKELSKYIEMELIPVLNVLEENAQLAITGLERHRNDEEHNEGVIIRSIGSRKDLIDLHSHVHTEFKRFQASVLLAFVLISRASKK